MKAKIYERNGKLSMYVRGKCEDFKGYKKASNLKEYYNTRFNQNFFKLRLATGLKDSKQARAWLEKHFELFLHNKKAALNEYFKFEDELVMKELKRQDKAQSPNKDSLDFKDEGLKALCEAFLSEKQRLKKSTIAGYKNFIELFKLFCQKSSVKKLESINDNTAKEFVYFLKDRQDFNSTIKTRLTQLRNLYKFARLNGFLKREILSPIPKLTQDQKELEKSFIEPFSLDEILTLIRESSGDLKTFLTISFFTGARTGEVLALDSGCFDFKAKKIFIKASKNGKELDTPKTKSSFRKIDMLEILIGELQAFKNSKGFIIKSPLYRLRSEFKILQKRLNLQLRTLYYTRHSFASLMLQRGEEPMWVSKMLGHTNLNITLNHYAKYLPQSVENRAKFLQGVSL